MLQRLATTSKLMLHFKKYIKHVNSKKSCLKHLNTSAVILN